jgi:hypothetical protein
MSLCVCVVVVVVVVVVVCVYVFDHFNVSLISYSFYREETSNRLVVQGARRWESD